MNEWKCEFSEEPENVKAHIWNSFQFINEAKSKVENERGVHRGQKGGSPLIFYTISFIFYIIIVF